VISQRGTPSLAAHAFASAAVTHVSGSEMRVENRTVRVTSP